MAARKFYVKNEKGRQTMTNSERAFKEKQAADLITIVSTLHSPEVANSVSDCFGCLRCMSDWSLEEELDDLISKANDVD